MSEEVNRHEVRPAKLPAAKYEEVKARAQRILDLRGKPPYRAIPACSNFLCQPETGEPKPILSNDEALILSEFVTYWMPYLVEKAANKCPTCGSPSQGLHPAVQHEGEVHLCKDPWHNAGCLVEKKKEIPDVPMFSAPVQLSEKKWIPWDGGEASPVLPHIGVKVRFRNNHVSIGHSAGYWIWKHSGECDDIVAYMVME